MGYCISLLEKSGFETFFIDTAVKRFNISEIVQKIIKENIDVLIIKPNIMAYNLTLTLAKELRPYCRHIICMGPVASSSKDFFLLLGANGISRAICPFKADRGPLKGIS